MPESEKKVPLEFSKSKQKEKMLAIQQVGKRLIDLPIMQLEKIPLPSQLLDAIHTAHTLKSHEAKRRHLQYIGKIMREIDLEPIEHVLQQIKLTNADQTAQFHQVEKWRDELVVENDVALQKLMVAYPDADRQYLRQLIRKSHQDLKKQSNSGAAKELFRYLSLLLEEKE